MPDGAGDGLEPARVEAHEVIISIPIQAPGIIVGHQSHYSQSEGISTTLRGTNP
jgi:hypothetical protein